MFTLRGRLASLSRTSLSPSWLPRCSPIATHVTQPPSSSSSGKALLSTCDSCANQRHARVISPEPRHCHIERRYFSNKTSIDMKRDSNGDAQGDEPMPNNHDNDTTVSPSNATGTALEENDHMERESPDDISTWSVVGAKLFNAYNSMQQVLGPEVGCAHFLLTTGCLVRFKGHEELIEYVEQLPDTTNMKILRRYRLEEVNGGPDCRLAHNGVFRMAHLEGLKTMRFFRAPHVDDFMLERFADFEQVIDSLEHLELIGIRKVTDKGLQFLAEFKNLKTLKLLGLQQVSPNTQSYRYLKAMLPDCDIEVDAYLEPLDDDDL